MKNLNLYKPSIFLGLNDELDVDVLKSQMDDVRSMNIGAVMLHARLGLKTEYFGEKWFEICDQLIEYAKKINLNIWLYDEKGWPSGFGGGACLEGNLYPVKYLEFCDGNVVIRQNDTYVDLCNPHATDRFIEHTYLRYYERYKPYIGNTILGIFTDEPQYYRWATPYSDVLAREWRKYYDYDMKDRLNLLFVDTEASGSFRYDYYTLLSKLFIENYIERLYRWCHKRNFVLTGHTVEEISFGYQIMACGSAMPFYEFEDLPGIDYLGNKILGDLSAKQCVSVACQRGIKDTLVEIFAGSGNAVTPKHLKHLYDTLAVDGINLMVQSIYQFTNKGDRKRDYPVDFSRLLPWQDSAYVMNEYFMHVANFISTTHEKVQTLILYPIKSAYFAYRREDMSTGDFYYHKLLDLTNMMKEYRIPFHLGDEDILCHLAKVENNQFIVGECTYDKVILPDMKSITKNTYRLLKEFEYAGGKIYSYGEMPSYIDGRISDVKLHVLKFAEIKAESQYEIQYGENVKSSIRVDANGKNWIFLVNMSETDCADIILLGVKLHLDERESCILDLDNLPCWRPEKSVGIDGCCFENSRLKKCVELDGEWKLEKGYQNSLVIDSVEFSIDDKQYKSMSVNEVRKSLFDEKYNGKIFLKYPFTSCVERLEKLDLVIEKQDYQSLFMNGNRIEFSDEIYGDQNFKRINIGSYLKKGVNEIKIESTYFQRETLYDLLHNPANMESVKNAIYYDSEIENIYLLGNFNVNSELLATKGNFIQFGSEFSIDSPLNSVSLSNLSETGFSSLFGRIKIEKEFYFQEKTCFIKIKSNFAVINVWLNDEFCGKIILGNRLDVSQHSRLGKNHLTLELITGNRNMFGPFHVEDECECIGAFHYEMSSQKYLMQNLNIGQVCLYTESSDE